MDVGGGVLLTVDDGSLEMRHHLQVVIVLDVVAGDGGDLAVDDHELAVEGAEWRAMEVDDGQIDVGHRFGGGQADSSRLPRRRGEVLVVVEELGGVVVRFQSSNECHVMWDTVRRTHLLHVSPVEHQLDDDALAPLLRAPGELEQGVGDEGARARLLPKVGRQQDLPPRAHDQVGHVAQLVVQRGDDGHGHKARRAGQRRRGAVGGGVAIEGLQQVVVGAEEELAGLAGPEAALLPRPLEIRRGELLARAGGIVGLGVQVVRAVELVCDLARRQVRVGGVLGADGGGGVAAQLGEALVRAAGHRQRRAFVRHTVSSVLSVVSYDPSQQQQDKPLPSRCQGATRRLIVNRAGCAGREGSDVRSK